MIQSTHLTVTQRFSVDEFGYNDPLEETGEREPVLYSMMPECPDLVLEHRSDQFEQFVETLPTRLHRQVAWTLLYDGDEISVGEFYVSRKELNAVKAEVTNAYREYCSK